MPTITLEAIPETEWLGTVASLHAFHPDDADPAPVVIEWRGDVQVIGLAGDVTTEVLELLAEQVRVAGGDPYVREVVLAIDSDRGQSRGWIRAVGAIRKASVTKPVMAFVLHAIGPAFLVSLACDRVVAHSRHGQLGGLTWRRVCDDHWPGPDWGVHEQHLKFVRERRPQIRPATINQLIRGRIYPSEHAEAARLVDGLVTDEQFVMGSQQP